MARLELFQSPARFNNFFASLSNVCEINENGYVGGGFISASMIVSICLEGGISKVQASRVDAIQVRIFIPSMGIFKGVLMKKEIVEGALIQLPQSMQKVLASKNPGDLKDQVAILVCKNGIHPSPGSANEYIGRRLNPDLKDPPEKFFKDKIKKPLTDMILTLWKTLGVNICARNEKCQHKRTICHKATMCLSRGWTYATNCFIKTG